MPPVASSFALTPGTRLRRLDDEFMVFNPWSWETHLLNAEAVLIVRPLIQGPKSLEQLQAEYRDAHGDLDPEVCDRAAESLLLELVELGLVSQDLETGVHASS
jgi:PqqD family protein of HPr-rel-A system